MYPYHLCAKILWHEKTERSAVSWLWRGCCRCSRLVARRSSRGSRFIFRSVAEVWARQREDAAGFEECRGVLLGGYPSRGCRGSVRDGISVGVKITRPMADQIRAANSFDAESLVRAWMRGWKQLSKSRAVTVTIEWQDIEIAKAKQHCSAEIRSRFIGDARLVLSSF